MRHFIKISLLFLLITSTGSASAQSLKLKREEHDTTYIKDLREYLTVRTFVSNKFAKYTPGHYGFDEKVSYKGNDNYNIGFGFFYKYFGINIALKAPFVNNDVSRRGKTKFLDAQAFLYKRKITADIYYRTHEGYYLTDWSVLNTKAVSNIFPLRPDLRTWTAGTNVQYMFNGGRFSYRAPFLQNEQQLKSAGSLIAGVGLHVVGVKADSAIIPADIVYGGYFGNSRFNRSTVVSLAVNGGYAHTLVIKRHWFITGSLVGGAGVNYTLLKDEVRDKKSSGAGLQLDGIVRVSAGYNSERYFAGVQYINFINRNHAPISGAWQQFQSGYMRLTLAKRFKLGEKAQSRVDKVEDGIKDRLRLH